MHVFVQISSALLRIEIHKWQICCLFFEANNPKQEKIQKNQPSLRTIAVVQAIRQEKALGVLYEKLPSGAPLFGLNYLPNSLLLSCSL